MDIPTDLLTSEEASKLLEVDKSTLIRWVSSGDVKPVRKLPGKTGAFLFERSDIEDLRDRRAAENAEAAAS
ncbi:helix-turn-helix domain-containing protein [Nocardia vaccinii]|uniref:helix-turn-helix domain-containing protein n=1 Tax=Nocardia vaccinii TaxID=1822 RepID=UPI00082B96C5|nr:helix-turn-helix domain-containing protein [Nocardia vaccinii]